MQRQGISLIQLQEMGIVEIKLGILSVCDVQERMLSLRIGSESQSLRETIEQITCRLHIQSESIYPIAIGQSKSHLHDKDIFVIIAQDGISIINIVEIILLECLRNPRHIHIVEIEQVEAPSQMMTWFCPAITPCRREDAAMELRTVLQIPAYRQLAISRLSATEILGKERCHESWKYQLSLYRILGIVLVLISLQTGYRLVGSTEFDA